MSACTHEIPGDRCAVVCTAAFKAMQHAVQISASQTILDLTCSLEVVHLQATESQGTPGQGAPLQTLVLLHFC